MNAQDRIVVTCPGCRRQSPARTDFVGRAVRCKHHDCGMVFEVPAPNPSPQVVPAPAHQAGPAPKPFSLAVLAHQSVVAPPPRPMVRNEPTSPVEQKGPAGRRREWWFAAGGVGLFVFLVVVGVWGYHRGMARTRQDREADRVTPAEKAKEADRLAADLASARATAERGKATEADREKAVAAGREQAAAVRPSANPKLPAEVKKAPNAGARVEVKEESAAAARAFGRAGQKVRDTSCFWIGGNGVETISFIAWSDGASLSCISIGGDDAGTFIVRREGASDGAGRQRASDLAYNLRMKLAGPDSYSLWHIADGGLRFNGRDFRAGDLYYAGEGAKLRLVDDESFTAWARFKSDVTAYKAKESRDEAGRRIPTGEWVQVLCPSLSPDSDKGWHRVRWGAAETDTGWTHGEFREVEFWKSDAEGKPAVIELDSPMRTFATTQLKPSQGALGELLKAEVAVAKEKKLKPYVELYADWWKPSRAMQDTLDDPGMTEAYRGTYIIRLDADQWKGSLAPLGFVGDELPAFFELGDSGLPTKRKINGSVWDAKYRELAKRLIAAEKKWVDQRRARFFNIGDTTIKIGWDKETKQMVPIDPKDGKRVTDARFQKAMTNGFGQLYTVRARIDHFELGNGILSASGEGLGIRHEMGKFTGSIVGDYGEVRFTRNRILQGVPNSIVGTNTARRHGGGKSRNLEVNVRESDGQVFFQAMKGKVGTVSFTVEVDEDTGRLHADHTIYQSVTPGSENITILTHDDFRTSRVLAKATGTEHFKNVTDGTDLKVTTWDVKPGAEKVTVTRENKDGKRETHNVLNYFGVSTSK